jgi:hypothetical protein
MIKILDALQAFKPKKNKKEIVLFFTPKPDPR